MNIWGTVVGGVAGFAIGGPLGAVIGTLAGHVLDRARGARLGAQDTEAKQIAFTAAVVVLGAKMAKADGVVTPAEIQTFKQIFHIPREHMEGVGRLFNEAKREASGYEPYAHQIATMFSRSPAVKEELLHALFEIAKADGVIHPKELEFMDRVGHIFGFGEETLARIRAGARGPGESDPYATLGVSQQATSAEVKSAWRKLTRENHPDTLIAQGMPQEFIDLATEKMATINAAYDRIARERGIN